MAAMRILRVLKLTLATAWAGALVVTGMWLWPIDTVLATCWLAAGQCVAMWLIADDLFPDALPSVKTFFKFAGAMVFLMHLVAVIWLFFGAG